MKDYLTHVPNPFLKSIQIKTIQVRNFYKCYFPSTPILVNFYFYQLILKNFPKNQFPNFQKIGKFKNMGYPLFEL